MEFSDDIYKRVLVDEGGKLTNAHIKVIENKCSSNGRVSVFDLKQIELAYQCFRKKYPQFPENSFRRYCWIRGTVGKSLKDVENTKDTFSALGWETFSDSEIYR